VVVKWARRSLVGLAIGRGWIFLTDDRHDLERGI
jgi:hypothetical protein